MPLREVNMTTRLRLGIVGTGIAARDLHWPPLRMMQDRFEIVALSNRTRSKAEDFARLTGTTPRITTDYQELLSWPEVEAVDVLTPIVLNAPVAVAALQAGKHVIMEKPIGANVAAGREVVEEARRHPDRVLLVAENVRYSPDVLLARQLLQEGRIGRVMLVRIVSLSPLSPESPYTGTAWRQQPEHLGGYLSDGGVHEAAALHMLGGSVREVGGMIAAIHPEVQPSDTLLANVRFASGALGALTLSFGVQGGEEHPLRVDGTDGSLAVFRDRIELHERSGPSSIPVPEHPTGYERELEDFYEAVTTGKRPEVTPEDALADLLVIDAAFRSSAEGQTVTLLEAASSQKSPPSEGW